MRPTLVLAVLLLACGITHDGPPPRFAEAPPEPSAPEREERPDAGTPPPVVIGDGGASADAGVAALDGGGPVEVDGGLAGPALATGPLTAEQWTALLDVGRRKWNRVCGECHGTGIGPVLTGRRLTAERVRRTVRQGRGDMRPLSERRVSAEELEGVLVYLSTIRAVSDVSPPAQGSPAQ